MNLLVQKIFDNIRPKNINGGYMNGPMFLNLAKMYINSLNSDELPNINTSWKIVIDSQLKSAYNTGLEYYINEMNNLDYKNYLTSEKIYKEHYDIKEKSLSYIMEYSNMNIPTNIFIDTYKNLEKKIDEEFINNYYNKWENECKSQCENIYIKLIEEYKKSPELNEIFACLNTITEVLNFIDKSDTNEKKYEIMYPKIISFFIEFLKKEFKDNKMKNEQKMNELQQELIYNQDLLEKNKKIIEETRNNYEIQLKEIKEENLENRIDLESKIDEKEKIIQNIKTSNENKIEEMKLKIDELNNIIISYQNQEQELAKDKKNKKNNNIDDKVLLFKLDAITNRIDSIQDIFYKNELEKEKNKMLLEMDNKLEQIQKEFKLKLKNAKKNLEKNFNKIKESKDTEIEKLKQIIKDLNEEIQDYKSQIDSLEYKISLYKEKIINYEKEKKTQADHAELLRILTGKLSGYVEQLNKNK
jgi:DNA repair exonuclease SbcCD ATPase subunit